MQVTKLDALRLLKRYTDGWRAGNAIEEMLRNAKEPPEKIGSLLWEVVRDEDPDGLAGIVTLIYHLGADPSAYDANDVLRFLHAMAVQFPTGRKLFPSGGGWNNLYDEEGFPGWPYNFERVLDGALKKPDGGAVLAKGWSELPEPYRMGLGVMLAVKKVIPKESLSPKYVDVLVRARATREPSSAPPYETAGLFTPEEWRDAGLRLLRDKSVEVGSTSTIERSAGGLTGTELVELIKRAQDGFAIAMRLVAMRDQLAKDARDALADGLRALPPKGTTRNWQEQQREIGLLLLYLALCQRDGVVPDEVADERLETLLADADTPLFQSGSEHRVPWLRVIPEERLERALLSAPTFPITAIAACATDRVWARFEKALAGPFSWQARSTFGELPRVLAPLAATRTGDIAKLAQSKALEMRHEFIRFLGEHRSPEALAGLVPILSDDAKGVRGQAYGALYHYPEQDQLETLKPLLKAGSKDLRLSAAERLAGISQSPERDALARERLAVEKVSAIRDLLVPLVPDAEPAKADAAAAHPAFTNALRESNGERWREFKDRDPAEQLAAFRAFIGENTHYGIETPPMSHWLELLESVASHPRAATEAVGALPLLYERLAGEYLEKVSSLVPGIPTALVALIESGVLGRKDRHGRNLTRILEDAYRWLGEQTDPVAMDTVAAGRFHKTAGVQKVCAAALANAGEAAVPALAKLLASAKPAQAPQVVLLLQGTGSLKAVKALEDALNATPPPPAPLASAIKASLDALAFARLRVDAFPLTAEGDAALDQALAALPRVAGREPLPSAPKTVHWARGAALSEGARAKLLEVVADLNLVRESPALFALCARLHDDDRRALFAAATGGRAPSRFPVWHVALLGGEPEIDELREQLDLMVGSSYLHWGQDGLDALVRHGSPAAIRAIERASRTSKSTSLRGRAQATLQAMARLRGVSVEELLDSALPDLGFDAQGRRDFEYAGKKYQLRLDAKNEIELYDAAGAKVAKLPKPKTPTDADKAQSTALTRLKKDLEQIQKAQGLGLEGAMASGRVWPAAVFTERFLRHPLLRSFARALVFSAEAPEGGGKTTFRIDATSTLRDANNAEYKLAPDARVRVVHPVSLSESEHAAWKKVFDAEAIDQPFQQLHRAFTPANELPKSPEEWKARYPMGAGTRFANALRRQRYEPGHREDAGMVFGSHRRIGPYTIGLRHDGYTPGHPEWSDQMELKGISIHREGGTEALTFAAVPPELQSEILRDLQAFGDAE